MITSPEIVETQLETESHRFAMISFPSLSSAAVPFPGAPRVVKIKSVTVKEAGPRPATDGTFSAMNRGVRFESIPGIRVTP
jgi:hypothetical protein